MDCWQGRVFADLATRARTVLGIAVAALRDDLVDTVRYGLAPTAPLGPVEAPRAAQPAGLQQRLDAKLRKARSRL